MHTPDHPTPDHEAAGHPTPGDPTPGDPTPGDPTPGDPTPDDPTPDDPTPDDPTPDDPTPDDPTPDDPTPDHPTPDHPTPGHPTPDGMVPPTAQPADLPAVAAVLAGAFLASENLTWIVPDPHSRQRLLPALFAGIIRHRHPVTDGGLVAVVDGRLLGVAVWVPPPHHRPSWWRQLRVITGLLGRADAGTLWALGTRGLAVDRSLASAHPDAPHWYLAYLATLPGAGGSGIGTALLAAGLDRARRAGNAGLSGVCDRPGRLLRACRVHRGPRPARSRGGTGPGGPVVGCPGHPGSQRQPQRAMTAASRSSQL